MSATREQLLTRMPVTERRMELAGAFTAVLEGGEGPPIVLLHGQGEFAATWMRVIPHLVTSYRVVVPDLPGHGASTVGDGGLDRERVLAWLGELIAQTCPSPPVVVGHLLGGAIAARYAVAHGDRISRLVLVDTLGLSWFRPSPGFALAMVAFVARPNERSRERLFDRCFVDLDAMRQEMGDDLELLEAYALEGARSPQLKTALNALMPRVGVPPIPEADLAGIGVPTAMIWGRHDLQVRVGVAERAAARYGWPLHIIEDVADDPPAERPLAFVEALNAVLATRDSRRAPT